MPKQVFKQGPCPWKGFLSGATAGLAATIVMTQFQNAWTKAADAGESKGEDQKSVEKEDATTKVAGKLAQVVGRPISRAQKKKAGRFIHFGFGTAMGAFYGLVKELSPKALRDLDPLITGIVFGVALFGGGDEIAVPALGLSKMPWESPASEHAYGLASHLIYGATLGAVEHKTRRLGR